MYIVQPSVDAGGYASPEQPAPNDNMKRYRKWIWGFAAFFLATLVMVVVAAVMNRGGNWLRRDSSVSLDPNSNMSDENHQQPDVQLPEDPSTNDHSTNDPSERSSIEPSTHPSTSPSTNPTVEPSAQPTIAESWVPSSVQSSFPSVVSSYSPSTNPSAVPTMFMSSEPTDAPLETIFYAIGDVPYTAVEAVELGEQMDNLPLDAEFVIHVGDLRQAGPKCKLEEYEDVATILRRSHAPVFVILGDNDWTDCPNDKDGFKHWNAVFNGFENYWNHTFDIIRQPGRTENFSFVHKQTLFIGLNIVGGEIHDRNEWSAA